MLQYSDKTIKYQIWRRLYPDAKLFEFMGFIQQHWDEFFALKGMKRPISVTGWHEEFDAWLAEKYQGPSK